MATKFGMRPSQLLQIRDEYVEFCVDEVVFYFGSSVEARLEEVPGDTPEAKQFNAEMEFGRIFGVKPKFADPMAMMKKDG